MNYDPHQAFDVRCAVRVLDGCTEGEEVTQEQLRTRIAAVSNLPLPEDHAAGWEALLGPRVLLEGSRGLGTSLIFRVHHTVGDGPALLNLLLDALADQMSEEIQPDVVKKMRVAMEKIPRG